MVLYATVIYYLTLPGSALGENIFQLILLNLSQNAFPHLDIAVLIRWNPQISKKIKKND